MYSVEKNGYVKMSIQEFAEATENGLVTLQGVPGLKQALKKLKEEKEL
jgi:hypothetical protein